jgi:hypothetical protein
MEEKWSAHAVKKTDRSTRDSNRGLARLTAPHFGLGAPHFEFG